MTDTHCTHVPKNKEKFREAKGVPEEKADEACVKDKQIDSVNALNRAPDVGILKEQNFFIDTTGCVNLSKLYSNRNCTNSAYISSIKDKPLAGLNDIRRVCDDLSDKIEENAIFTDVKTGCRVNDGDLLQPNKENSLNGLAPSPLPPQSEDGPNANTPEPSEVVYYAMHIPVEFPLQDVQENREENLHVYVNKEEVLKVVKLNKKARFKQFKTRKEAEEFAIHGGEVISHDGLSAMSDNEKVMPFKRPKTEDMIQFRKDIEKGNIEAVRETIFENPKYLVSNGDTPSILQEGSRYNALHVAAKSKNAEITRLILDSITRLDFIGYLYDDNDIESCVARSAILLDRYLNTPDKGANETPLHLAVKHGAVDVVQVLLSYSQCQKNNVFNKYNQLPKDIICNRVCGPCEETKAAIASMLEEQYFVPVLRSEDNSLQPKVGEAFSITNPLKLESDLLSPRLEIQAYAGPMSKEKADLFKKLFKAPTRRVKDANSPMALRLRDTEKGLEKTGRNLASELDVPWQEFWSFLDTFVDISSETGLKLLENYLKKRFQESFAELQQENYSNCHADSAADNTGCSISELCEAFENCGSHERNASSNCNEFLCSTPRLKKHSVGHPASLQRDHSGKKLSDFGKMGKDGKNPVVYVERSCEVFGKRIGTAINSCVLFENHSESLKESLETQIKHLQTLIRSYKEDARFQSVDFQLIHSRVATVAIQTLQNVTNKNKQLIMAALKGIDWSDGALSDDEDLNYNHRNQEELGITTKQLHCLVKHLMSQLHEYQEKDQVSPSVWSEADCQMLWAQATPCKCIWTKNSAKRFRGGLKRKPFRSECDCDCDVSPRKIQFDDERDEFSEALAFIPDEDEDQDRFSTPPSGNSDTEEDAMEDVVEIPNTFIYPGSLPTKTDYAVLEAIEKVPVPSDKYPHVHLWRYMLELQPRTAALDHHNSSLDTSHRKSSTFDMPKSSPCKLLDRSLGNTESPPVPDAGMEPWERVTGPYSPRRSNRSSLSILYYQDSPVS